MSLKSALARLVELNACAKQSKSKGRKALSYEQVEERRLMTVTVTKWQSGELELTGSSGADTVSIAADLAGDVTNNGTKLTYNGANIAASAVGYLRIFTFGGADSVDLRNVVTGSFTSLLGTYAELGAGGTGTGDTFHGSPVSDVVYGNSFTEFGDDVGNTIYGYGGNDALHGAGGYDSIIAGDGSDTLLGYAGIDYLKGEAGNDTCVGGAGNDNIDGGDGNDSLTDVAASDIDTMSGGGGNDFIDARDGDANDSVMGGTGADEIWVDQPTLDNHDAGVGDKLNGTQL